MTAVQFSLPYSQYPATLDVAANVLPAGWMVWDFVSETIRVGDSAGRMGGKVIDPAGYVRPEFMPGFAQATADVTMHINAASVLAAALGAIGRGNGKVAVQGGTTYRVKDLDIADGCTLESDNLFRKATLLRAGACTKAVVALHAQASNVGLRGVIVDGQSAADLAGLIDIGNPLSNILIERFVLQNGLQKWCLRADPTVVAKDIKVTDGKLLNCPAGIIWLPTVKGHTRLTFQDLDYENVGGNCLQIGGIAASPWDCNFDVLIQRLNMHDPQMSGAAGPIPIELQSCTRVVQREIAVNGAFTRGLTAGGYMTDGILESCEVRGNTTYVMECGPMKRVCVRDITGVNTPILFKFTSNGTVQDVYFSRMRLYGTGLTAYNAGNPADVVDLEGAMSNVRMQDVKAYDADYARSYFRIAADATSTISMEDCGAYARTPYSPLLGTTPGQATLTNRNFVYSRTADVPADHYQAAISAYAVQTPIFTGANTYRLRDATVEFSGALLGAATLGAIGDAQANAPRTGLSIRGGAVRGNFSSGVKIADSGGTAEVVDVDVTGFAGTINAAIMLHAAIIKRKFLQDYEATSIPTAGPSTPAGTLWKNIGSVAPVGGKVLAGWRKITAGATYVAGTDITPVYETNA